MTSAYSSEAEIANLALAHLGKPFITNINASSVEASKARFHLPMARRTALRRFDWIFARRIVRLAGVTDTTYRGRYDIVYDTPNAALKVWSIVTADRPDEPITDFRIENGRIYTNLSEASCRYTADVREPSAWPEGFAEAVACKLAEKMAPSMTRRRSDIASFRILYEEEIMRAAEQDSGQEHHTYTESNRYAEANTGGVPYEGAQADGSSIWDN